MKIAVLGTGIMGVGVAHSLLRHDLDVTVWNRTRSRAETLAADGATVASTALDAVRDADVVLMILYDGQSILEVLTEIAEALPARAIVVQMSTIGLDGARQVSEYARSKGLTLVEAMMLGTKKPAEDGTLVLITAGNQETLAQLDEVFDVISTRSVYAGFELGKATAVKLACNAYIASITAAVGQSVALATSLGVDPDLFLQSIAGGAVDTPYAHLKSAQMISGDLAPSFTLDGVCKDVSLIRAAATEVGVSTTMLDAMLSLFESAAAAGHGREDMAAVHFAFLPSASTKAP